MKILITYSSQTGNTQKIAKSIHSAIPEADILSVSEIINLDYDLIFIGGWIDRATFDETTLTLAKQIFDKNVAYFFTLGAYPDSDHAKDCINNIKNLLKENNNHVIGGYFCQGAIAPKLIAWFSTLTSDHKMAPSEERIKRWEDAKSHPNKEDLKKSKEFALSILNKLNQNK
ncbi:MAG: flavodoxin family protein [Cetobacterium sp.]|uniref:flavodoxin family protein n=1 Tax=Cetobacterium sp. TaxID=2071632 RepID=UPI003F2CF20C